MLQTTQHRISIRLKALRESNGLTQDALARAMGFKHRQIIASIEAGERAISADELVRAAKALRVDMDVLTDSFRLVGEGRFSFRAEGVPAATLDQFEDRAGRWIATFRTLQSEAGIQPSRLGQKLELTATASFEDAHAAAEQIRQEWSLGDRPAETLRDAVERALGVQVLFVDAPSGLSGAAVQLPGLNTILINRRESEGRRHFDLAHELFHVLTWDAMAPERVEPREPRPGKGNRVERLADNFAGALLMPEHTVATYWAVRREGEDIHDWLNAAATALHVSAVALKWRVVILGHVSKAAAEALDESRLANNGGLVQDTAPLPFNRPFVGRVYHAVEDGRLSLRKAVDLLGLGVDAFSRLCGAYNLELSYEV